MPKLRDRMKPTKSSAKRSSATSPPHGGRGRYATSRFVATRDQIDGLLLWDNVRRDLMVQLLFLSRPAQVRDLVLDL